MKSSPLLLALVLCSCSQESDSSSNVPLISTDETRRVAMHVLLNRYPKAEIVSEQTTGPTATYRFATNGTTVPLIVVVDRKAGKAHFERVNP